MILQANTIESFLYSGFPSLVYERLVGLRERESAHRNDNTNIDAALQLQVEIEPTIPMIVRVVENSNTPLFLAPIPFMILNFLFEFLFFLLPCLPYLTFSESINSFLSPSYSETFL
jgi:hypothetical protein